MITPRAQAKAVGAKTYRTGKPCTKGHHAPRRTDNGACVECHSKNTPERKAYMKAYMEMYRRRENEKVCSLKRAYYGRHKERLLDEAKAYRSENRGLYVMLCQQRRTAIRRATPRYLSDAHRLEIREIYDQCAALNRRDPGSHHVDHIVPIQGDTVCGLHVPWNLRVITAQENTRKGNKLQ